jgi:putative protease
LGFNIPNLGELKKSNIRKFRLDFVDENYNETCSVIENYKKGNWEEGYVNFTRGHYKRGVE